MTTTATTRSAHRPAHGQIGYLQLPASDLRRAAQFYQAVFGWSVDPDGGSFESPGMIGQFSTLLRADPQRGPVVWIAVERLGAALRQAEAHGAVVTGPPQRDGPERWLAELEDPLGNRIGLYSAAPRVQSQTLIAVRDVETASAWYQDLLGLRSDHGGPDYERLLSGDTLVLQLHHRDIGHDHGTIGQAAGSAGNGVLLWFGEVADFDGVVERARRLGAPVVMEPHRNPPSGQGNGPGHREIWLEDLDGYTVVVASPDGEAFE